MTNPACLEKIKATIDSQENHKAVQNLSYYEGQGTKRYIGDLDSGFIEGYGAHQERIKAQKTQKLSPFLESIPKKSPFRESNLKPTTEL